MGSNVSEFNLGIKKWGDAIPEEIAKYKRAVVFQAARSVIRMSPVDSGFFRSRWTLLTDADIAFSVVGAATIAAFRASGLSDTAISDGEILMRIAQKLPDVKPFTIVALSNDAPYAQRLEDGHSQQAPVGMVAVTAAHLAASGFAKLDMQ